MESSDDDRNRPPLRLAQTKRENEKKKKKEDVGGREGCLPTQVGLGISIYEEGLSPGNGCVGIGSTR